MKIQEIAPMTEVLKEKCAAPCGRPVIAEPCDVPMRVPVPVQVTHYSGPTKLSLRYRLPDACSALDRFHVGPGKRHLYEASIGMPCLVCTDSSTGLALRALVTDVQRSQGIPVMLEVLFVDSGQWGVVGLDAVYAMDADAAAEPHLAVSCCIRGVTPTAASSRHDLQELSKDGQPLYEALFCEVTDAGVYVVELRARLPRKRAGPTKVDVAEFLVRNGYAERFGYLGGSLPASTGGACQVEYPESDKPSLSLLPVHEEPATEDIFLPESESKSAGAPKENSFDMKVTFTCTPDHFYGQKTSTARKLTEVHRIVRTCTTRLEPESKARKGTYQIYRESPQDTGSRVRVEDVLEPDRCKVFMIDYGNRKTVNSSCLYKADPRLFCIEPLALRFQLVGTAPRRQWTEAAVKHFLELTHGDAPLTAVVVGTKSSRDEFNDTIHMVKLLSKVHGSVAASLGQPRAPFDPMRQDYESPLNSYSVNTDDPGVAASNFAVGRGHRVCKFFSSRGSCREGDRCTYSHVVAEPGSALLHVQEPATNSMQLLQPPEVGSWVLGQVSACAGPRCFYLVLPHGRRSLARLLDEGGGGPRETLDSLMQDLQALCSQTSSFRENRLVVRAEGEMVAAQSSRDGRWYRALVVSAEEGDLLTVFFVDFGFSECVQLKQVKSLDPRFTHLPLQALEACLLPEDLEPMSTQEAFKAFEECVSGRDLMVEVVRIVQDLLYVRLFFMQDGSLCSVHDYLKNWQPQGADPL